jgi:H+/Cl- antiporter ClcA
MGRWLVVAGIVLVVIGLAVTWAPWLVSWFGRLPGDIRIEGENGRIYVPITSMIVVSLVLTLVVNLFFRR